MVLTFVLVTAMGPALAAGAILVIACRPDPLLPDRLRRQWAVPVAVGAGFIAGWVGCLGWPPFPPTESMQWLFYAVIAASALGVALSRWPQSSWLRWSARVSLTAGLLWLMLQRIREFEWEHAAQWYWLGGLTVGMLVVWTSQASLAKRLPGRSILPVLIVVSAGTGVAALLGGFAKFAQVGGALTSVLSACWVISLRRPSFSLAPGGIDVVMVILWGLWLGIYFLAEIPAASALLLAVAPFGAWLIRPPPREKHKLWQNCWLGVLATTVAVLAAILIAYREYATDGSGYY